MKLRVVMSSAVEPSSKEINIRNPTATIGNLRASIAVHFKLDPHRFRMVHPTAAMDDETLLLSAGGIREGDTITLVHKRDREDSGVAAPADLNGQPPVAAETRAADTVSAVPPSTTVAVGGMQLPMARPSDASSSLSIGQIVEALALASNRSSLADGAAGGSARTTGVATVAAGQASLRSTVASNRSTRNRHTMPHGIEEEPISLDFARQHEDDDGDDEEDEWEDEEGDAGDEEDEEEDEEEGEEEDAETADQQELVQLLLEAPNVLELREQFLHAPEAMLTQIRDTNPRLFQLIAANSQFFLELVQNEDLLATLREEAAGADEHYLYEEGEEELDSEDEEESEMISNMLINALQQQAAARGARRGRGDNSTGDVSANHNANTGGSTSSAPNVPSLVPSARSTRSSHPRRNNTSSGRGSAGDASAAAAGGGGSRVVIPTTISPEDNEKIESLMQLGFTREQCVAAYFRANRSIDRAANLLFENPPTI